FLTEESQISKEQYQQFIELLHETEPHLSLELVSCFEIIAINFGIRKGNRGKIEEYGEFVLALQKRRVETGRIFIEGVLMAREYQSIASFALLLKEFDWALKFIEANKYKVAGLMSSLEYYEFCLAMYKYHTGNKLEALRLLMDNEFEDLSCAISARILEIKILCTLELEGETKLKISEQLDARIEAGILFFFRLKGFPANVRTMLKRFMDTMKKIIRAKENRKWNILERIKKEVSEVDYIAERSWLLGIIDKILASKK
ncbi:MAG: hypothetical protein JNJ57_18855, partial [Saprospiraceae bacterium]|nr:hypothetical protein [Saprospiraceae bacterium]